MHRFLISRCCFVVAVATLAFLANVGRAQEKKADHDHPEHGPHKGQLIELGDEEYHAELVDDDATETITIYLLDNKAKSAVAVNAKELVVNVKYGSKVRQFKLKAKPQRNDPPGDASRFALKSKELATLLDNDKAEKRLRVTIKGKSFNAKIDHHHDHGEDKKKS